MIGITTKWHHSNVVLKNARSAFLLRLLADNASRNVSSDETEELFRKAPAKLKLKQGTEKQDEKKVASRSFCIVSVPKVLTLVSKEGAEEIVSLIGDDISKDPSFVVELNPRKWLLTEELLKLNLPKIYLYEQPNNCTKELTSLVKKNKERLILRREDFTKVSKIHYLDLKTGDNKLRKILDGIVEREWEDDCYAQFIRIITEPNLIKHLTMSVIFQNALMAFGRPCFYFIIVPSVWNEFENIRPWRTVSSVMFNILFDVKIFGTVDRKYFMPQSKEIPEPLREKYRQSNSTAARMRYENEKHLYVMKVEPKRNIFKDHIDEDGLIPLWLFVRHYLHKKAAKVIPQMEQFAPNCTLKLIKMDYTLFTEFRELSIEQILELFKEFRTWPEYKNTTFVSAVDNIMKDVQNTYLCRTEYDYLAEDTKCAK